MGHNGSGKSTLLKCIAKILAPNTGSITARGRMAAMLEVGSGFHPELSGRENIFLNGAILGMSRKEIEAKFDDIVDFSGVGEFIDQPVKNYSSGMYVRLGFSVSIHVEPEILLVDEVLAVGDMEFQERCMDKFAEFREDGRTVVVVSHGLEQMRTFCDEVAWLDHGRLKEVGPAPEVIDKYSDVTHGAKKVKEGQGTRFGSGEGGTGRVLPTSAAARAPPAARGRRPVPGAGALRSRNGVRAQCAGHPHAHRLERRPVADEHLAGSAQGDAPPPRVQCEDLVHPGQDRVQVVVDDDDRGPLARQVGHEIVEPLRPLGVDGGRRLVQDQQGGPHRQGDRDGEALALAPGQGPRVLAAQSRHAHCGEGGVGALGDLVAPEAQVLQGELDFGAHAPGHHCRVRVLPHVGDRPSEHVGGRVGHLLPAQRDAARVLGGDGVGHQPAAGAHQRRLPASRRADDRRHPARQLFEGHVVEDPRIPTDVVDGQGLAGDEGVSGHRGRSRRPPC